MYIDLLDPGTLKRFSREPCRITWIVHCAGLESIDAAEKHPTLCFTRNVTMAANLAAFAKDTGARLLYPSSACVFCGASSRPYKASHPVSPKSVYGRSKAQGERAVLSTDPDSVILRSGWLYGAYGDNFVFALLRALRSKSPSCAAGDYTPVSVGWDLIGVPTWARDVAEVMTDIMCNPFIHFPAGIFQYAPSGRSSLWEVACEIRHRAMEYGYLDQPVPILPTNLGHDPFSALQPKNTLLSSANLCSIHPVWVPDWKTSLHDFFYRFHREVPTLMDRPSPDLPSGILP